jgi:hypothetical protein
MSLGENVIRGMLFRGMVFRGNVVRGNVVRGNVVRGTNIEPIFYNATRSLARFENNNIIFYFEKRSSLLQRWRCSCKFKNRRIGSSPSIVSYNTTCSLTHF